MEVCMYRQVREALRSLGYVCISGGIQESGLRICVPVQKSFLGFKYNSYQKVGHLYAYLDNSGLVESSNKKFLEQVERLLIPSLRTKLD